MDALLQASSEAGRRQSVSVRNRVQALENGGSRTSTAGHVMPAAAAHAQFRCNVGWKTAADYASDHSSVCRLTNLNVLTVFKLLM